VGLGADQIFAAALDVDLGDGLIVILALVGITFLLIITLGVWMVRGTPRSPATNDE
jgi:hypothetical protein